MNDIKRIATLATTPQVISIKANRNKHGVRSVVTIHILNDSCCEEVKVCISNAAGKLIEKGNAKRRLTGAVWNYDTIHRNQIITGSRIIVHVWDQYGNKGAMMITL